MKAGGAEAGTLKDVLVGGDGKIEWLLVEGPAGVREVPVDGNVLLEEPRAPAA